MTFAEQLTFPQRQRLQFIEAKLLWEGSVQRREVCDVFHVTPNHLTREISRYRRAHRDFLNYDPETRAWRAGSKFRPTLASGSAEEYLSLLRARAVSGGIAILPGLGGAVAAEVLPIMEGKVDGRVLREVIRALRQAQGVKIRYQSLRDDDPTERTIWPHSMVFAGERWHLRAYDSRRELFRDFVLARVLSAEGLEDSAPRGPKEDIGWNNVVNVMVVPDPQFSKSQQEAIAREFGMKRLAGQFVWKVELRECLVPYFLVQHRLDLPTRQAKRRLITLKDLSLIERYAFPTKE